jgi:hypothetical protein
VIGVCRRSGTNFLGSLLECHVACGRPAPPIAEDHLLGDAPLLERYVARTARRWPRRWGDREQGAADLERALGDGLLAFLDRRAGGTRVVSRTPSTRHLDLARRLYAGADLVLLVRDGRSVAASLMTAWGWSFDRAVTEWRDGARRLLSFLEGADERVGSDGPRSLLVRYEDLLADLPNRVDELLAFVGLDRDGFDMDKARSLPVLGSSYLRDPDGRITWQPTPRTDDFDPTTRFGSWSPRDHDRFDWIAGDEQRRLGYPSEHVADARRRAAQHALDVVNPVRFAPRRARQEVVTRARALRAERRARRR